MIRQSPRKLQKSAFDESKQSDSSRVRLGRRTGLKALAGKKIRRLPDGTDNFEDYWTDEETVESETSISTPALSSAAKQNPQVSQISARRQSPRKKQEILFNEALPLGKTSEAKVDRRTGARVPSSEKVTLKPDGTENFEDCGTEGGSAASAALISARRSSLRNQPNIPSNVLMPDNFSRASGTQKLGRRTGAKALAGKVIRQLPDGTEDFEDYWTTEEASVASKMSVSTRESSTSKRSIHLPGSRTSQEAKRHQSPSSKPDIPSTMLRPSNFSRASGTQKLGRRTGARALAGKHIRLLPDGTENFEDYWTDVESDASGSAISNSITPNVSSDSEEGEKIMHDKSSGTSFRNVKINEAPSTSSIEGKNAAFGNNLSTKLAVFPNEEHSSSKSAKKGHAAVADTSNNVEGVLNKSKNKVSVSGPVSANSSNLQKEVGEVSSQILSPSHISPNKTLDGFTEKAKRSLFKDLGQENDFENIEKTQSQRFLKHKSKFFDGPVSEDESDNIDDGIATTNKIVTSALSSSRISLNKDTSINTSKPLSTKRSSSTSRNTSRSLKYKSKLVEDPVSEDESDNIEDDRIAPTRKKNPNALSSSRISHKDTSTNKSKSLSTKRSSLSTSLNTSRSLKNKSKLIEDPISEDESENIYDDRIASNRNQSALSSSIIYDNNETSTSQSKLPSTKGSSPRKSHSKYRSPKKKGKFPEDLISEDEYDVDEDGIPVVSSRNTNALSSSLLSDNKGISIKNSKLMSTKRSSPKKKSSRSRLLKSKSKLIEDTVSEDESYNVVHVVQCLSISASKQFSAKTNLPRNRSKAVEQEYTSMEETEVEPPKFSQNKKTISFKHKSQIVEYPLSENESANIGDSEIESTSNRNRDISTEPVSTSIVTQNNEVNISDPLRFSPRKSSKMKYHSTPKSPVKSSEPIEGELPHIAEEKISSARSRRKSVFDKSPHISVSKGTTSTKRKSKSTKNPGSGADLLNTKDSAIASDGNKSNEATYRSPQPSRSIISSNQEPFSNGSLQSLSMKRSKKQKLSASSSPSKRSRSIASDDEESPSARIQSGTSASKSLQLSQSQYTKTSRSSRSRSKLIENDTNDSGNEFADVEANEMSHASNGKDRSQKDPPKEKNTRTKKTNISNTKKRNQVVGDYSENLAQGNDLDANELPKGKKKRDKEVRAEPSRRSSRQRIAPLAFWCGERRLFKISGDKIAYTAGRNKDESSVASMLKVQNSLKQRKEKEQRKKKAKIANLPLTVVQDPETNENVDVHLHRPFECVEWTAVGGENGTRVPYYLAKTFNSPATTFGFLEIRPLEQKASQYAPNDNIHFVLQKGRVKVFIHKAKFVFEKNASFLVPKCTSYCIENLENSIALLSFCTFKVPFFPHQHNDEL